MSLPLTGSVSVTIAYALGLAAGAAPVGCSGRDFSAEAGPPLTALLEKLALAAADIPVTFSETDLQQCADALDLAGQRLRRGLNALLPRIDSSFALLMARQEAPGADAGFPR